MKILLLNQTFHPDVMATGQYLSQLAAELAARGHQVTVVTGRRAYDHPEKIFPKREVWSGTRIERVFSTRFGKSAKWRRAADFASFLFNCCLRLAVMPRQDVVVALTSPPLISFIAAWFTRIRGGGFCYWVMDLNPDEAVAAGWLDASSFAGKQLERFSRFSFNTASRIIALDRFMRDRITAKGISAGKINVIPPWSQDDQVRFDVAGRERFRAEHGLQNKFVVMYSGNHSPCHPLDTLLEAARRLSANAEIMFCFVGGGSEFKRVQAFKTKHALRNILCLPYQPLEQLSASLSAADLQVVVMGDPFVGIVHPCKLYNILAIGAPVLCIGPEPSHATEILAPLNAVVPNLQVRHGDVEGVLNGIENIRSFTPSASRVVSGEFLRKFSRAELMPKMVEAVEASQK